MFLELDPAGLLQQTLASEITGASWRLRRCSAAEGELADYADQDPLLDESKDKTRKSIERARASAHSILHRSLNQLRKLKSEEKRTARQAEKQIEKEQKQLEQAPESDPILDAFNAAIDSIMNCPEPDWAALDAELLREAELASNCTETPTPASALPQTAAELASNCEVKVTPELMANLSKRNLPCACKSGRIYRKCCGINEPKDWRLAA